jgi:hypothetical protein
VSGRSTSLCCSLDIFTQFITVTVCSPCKSVSEIETALKLGVHLNANSINEMLKIAKVREELSISGLLNKGSSVGLRINPLIGAGAIAALSTATATSKFGIPLTASTKPEILELIAKYPYIEGLMCHVGSQGMPVQLMANGVLVLCSLADEVDQLCLDSEGKKRIKLLDIGGGLSANYSSEAVSPTFDEYLKAIIEVYPGFHSQGRTIVTGRFQTFSFLACLVFRCSYPSLGDLLILLQSSARLLSPNLEWCARALRTLSSRCRTAPARVRPGAPLSPTLGLTCSCALRTTPRVSHTDST